MKKTQQNNKNLLNYGIEKNCLWEIKKKNKEETKQIKRRERKGKKKEKRQRKPHGNVFNCRPPPPPPNKKATVNFGGKNLSHKSGKIKKSD